MFLIYMNHPWLNVEKAIQCLMVFLAFAMLFMPILLQPKEASAVGPLVLVVVAGAFTLGGVVLHHVVNSCSECGEAGAGEGHRIRCPKGHPYYNCRSTHQSCYEESSS